MALEHLNHMLTLDYILDYACGTPDNFGEYNTFMEKQAIAQAKDPENYTPRHYDGYMRYVVDTHCKRYTIIARRRKNGTYDIKDFIEQEK